MPTPIDELDSETLAALKGPMTDGYAEAVQVMSNNPLRSLAFSFEANRYRYRAVLLGRLRIYGQDMNVCGVTALEEHAPEADVFRVQRTFETRTKGVLSYVIETSVTPTAIRLTRTEGGGTTVPPDCVPTVDNPGEPEGWAGQPGDVTYLFEDDSLVVGAEVATAGQEGEVLLFDSGLVPRKEFGMRWMNSGGLGGFLDVAALSGASGVRRFVYDFKLVGHRIPFVLKWTETTSHAGDEDVVDELEHSFNPTTGFTFTIDDGYPAYGYAKESTIARVVPV